MKKIRTDLNRIVILLLIILLPAFIISCGNKDRTSDSAFAGGTPVMIIHPHVMDFTRQIELNANTIFLRKEIIRATFQGFIDQIYKNIGDQIQRGDLLVTLKTKE
ncbi:MAG: hypothetical protein P8X42_15290, partial [Calditrichaceae bacterium]